jgi:uncharacterized protein YciU (UPF0263 family)
MKRALALLVGGVLILGSALAAHAQAPTVSFGGQMRVYGFAFNNITDFTDSGPNGANRDSQSFYFQRWRLWTNVESADKKAKAVWGLEVGDIIWGTGGGASGGEFRGCPGRAPFVPTVTVPPSTAPVAGSAPAAASPATVSQPGSNTRVGNGAGGCLGADGVNVETKHAYIWVDTGQWVPNSSITIGIQEVIFMNGPLGPYFDDDAAAIKLNMKFDPVDIELWTSKFGEGNVNNADDSDAYVGRVGVNITKDMRATLDVMLVNEQSLAGQSIGDNIWIGATFGAKLGTVQLDAGFVWGQRDIAPSATAIAAGHSASSPFSESGYGGYVMAQVPLGPINLTGLGWYTSGDSQVGPAGCVGPGTSAGCVAQGASRTLNKDSDKLPIPESGAGWFGGGGDYIAEWIMGNESIGGPSIGQVHYADPTGTYGLGAAVTYALTPALSLGGGVAYVGATDADGPYGTWAFEVDAGATYRFNPNLTFRLFGGFIEPDQGDLAWAVAFRTQYSF